jgi:hypothetical protein
MNSRESGVGNRESQVQQSSSEVIHAEKLGKTTEEAEAYAQEVVEIDLQEAGDEDVFRKIRADFDAAGVAQSDHQIRRTMDELLDQAIAAVKNA